MGKAGSGKDTVAAILHEQLGGKPFSGVYTLADPIRAEYKRFYPEGNPRLDRDKLQAIGEGYKEIYGEDVWVKMTETRISNDKMHPSQFEIEYYAIISDGRHKIEYDFFVLGKGYFVIWVECPDEIRFQRLLARDGTLQEKALKQECRDLWGSDAYVVNNSSTFEELKLNIVNFLQLMGR